MSASPVPQSRRRLLATVGLTGAATATGGPIKGVPVRATSGGHGRRQLGNTANGAPAWQTTRNGGNNQWTITSA